MRLRRTHAATALGIGAALALAPLVAIAAEPPQLGGEYVLDAAGALSAAEEADANKRLAGLETDGDIEMWVVYVDEFTSPADSAEWANATADLNGLGTDQYLLAIATETRQLFLSTPVEGGIGDSDAIAVEEAAADALRDDDWAGAVDAAADELEAQSAPNHTIWWVLGAIVVLALIVVAALALVRGARRRRAQRDAEEKLRAEVDEFRTRASGLLVEMDDSLRTAEQELGFAVAQFGPGAVADYEKALADARASLNRSFGIQQQLDDAPPETLQEERERYGEIVGLLEQADAALDEKAEGFERLRALEQNAPQVLERLTAQRAAAGDAPERIAAEMARLRETYASAAIDDVDDNADEARARLSFVDAELAEARAHLDAGETGEAALDLHDAEQGLGQLDELVDAITSLAPRFGEAEKRAAEMIAELEADIGRARSLADPDGRVARAIAATTEHIAAARENLAGTGRTPLRAAEALDAANDEIDAVIANAREAEEARRRQLQQIDQNVSQAQGAIASAERFVGTRRGGIGGGARSQLAQAQAALDQAIATRDTDPAAALVQARRARDAASQALSSARRDVQSYQQSGYGGYGRRSSSGLGGDIVGGLIGGLIGNAVAGGSRRGSGWGGSSRGGLGGFGGSSRGRSSSGRSGRIGRSSGGRRSGGRRF
ncbi:TPM domain-containing protein [Microbacterium karelineae]|uniref:TPM domain-containing protein n=1 Tax=Microbacterium karelineae TaxID=2654283 RepID=UPI0012EA33A3|nr:TPM domain-containing protein [Microbacterium karelineae]